MSKSATAVPHHRLDSIRISKRNPYLGIFHYGTLQSGPNWSFYKGSLESLAEQARRRRRRNNPFVEDIDCQTVSSESSASATDVFASFEAEHRVPPASPIIRAAHRRSRSSSATSAASIDSKGQSRFEGPEIAIDSPASANPRPKFWLAGDDATDSSQAYVHTSVSMGKGMHNPSVDLPIIPVLNLGDSRARAASDGITLSSCHGRSHQRRGSEGLAHQGRRALITQLQASGIPELASVRSAILPGAEATPIQYSRRLHGSATAPAQVHSAPSTARLDSDGIGLSLASEDETPEAGRSIRRTRSDQVTRRTTRGSPSPTSALLARQYSPVRVPVEVEGSSSEASSTHTRSWHVKVGIRADDDSPTHALGAHEATTEAHVGTTAGDSTAESRLRLQRVLALSTSSATSSTGGETGPKQAGAGRDMSGGVSARHRRRRRGVNEGDDWKGLGIGEEINDISEVARLDAPIGSGAFGAVHRGVWLYDGSPAAIKCVKRSYLVSDEERRAVIREVDLLRSTRHPSVVGFKGAYETASSIYIILELVEGRTLQAAMQQRSRFSEAQARIIVEQILEALEMLHTSSSGGVVHGDIKPENILLAEDRPGHGRHLGVYHTAKLCDFGNARRARDPRYFKETKSVALIPARYLTGTMGYIAPEILEGRPYNALVDMWSLGIVIYEMLAGFAPFYPYDSCRTIQASFPKHHTDHISAQAKSFVLSLLQQDPAQRMTASAARRHAWITPTPVQPAAAAAPKPKVYAARK